MPPRVALLAPFASPSVRGNAITVERIGANLRARGVTAERWDLSTTPAADVEREVAAFAPGLIHAFHAYRVGPPALELARRLEVPLLVTITGTDGNHDLVDPARAATVRDVLAGALAITVFHASMATRLEEAVPGLGSRIRVVPQSVWFEPASPAAPDPFPEIGAGPLLLFPAGIRMVKNPLFPLAPLDAVAARRPELRLLYVGPILDPAEGEALRAALAGRPWARYGGAVPHARMPAVLARAQVVLNCSLSEGGMANSVLEALHAGRAVVASDIEGNRALVEDGVTGFRYRTPADFADRIERLLADPELAERLGRAGRELVATRFGPAREIDGYLEVYERLGAALRAP